MKDELPEKYEPGELSETRRRLGDLNDAEAKKYADLLGGEIGVERSADTGTGEIKGAEAQPLGSRDLSGYTRFSSKEKSKKRKVPYLQRVKIDFLCASPPYRLKTKRNAIAGLFRFIFPRRDYINPLFLIHGEELYFTDIENLVTAVRALVSIAQYGKVLKKVPAYYMAILDCIGTWNIEGLHLEMVRLRQNPKRKHVKALRPLIRNAYIPFVKLSQLEDESDQLRALRSVYNELINLGIVGGKARKITTYYEVAKEELPIVFGRIQRMLYPLILKVYDADFIPYENLYSSARKEVCLYFSINDEQIVEKADYPDEEQKGEAEAGDDFDVDEFDTTPRLLLSPRYNSTDLFLDGGNLIEALFPKCGWKNSNEYTDFYAYFLPILPYPQGTDLLSPHSALMRVITLMLIIQELLPGFREIEFGVIRDEDENPYGVQHELSGILGKWYRYIEEIVGKRYIPMLHEYCRNLENDIRFRGSSYGKRLLSELNWIKKHYFLPYLLFNAESGARPPGEGSVDPLPDTVSTFLKILGAVSADNSDPEQDVSGSVKNPHEPFYFEVETVVSRRLRTVLDRYKLPCDNIVLIDAVYLLLAKLEEIILNPLGDGYETELSLPYRSEGEGGSSPVYTVEERDTISLLARDEREGTSEIGEP